MNSDNNNTVTSNPAPTNNRNLMNNFHQMEICDLVESRLKNGERVTMLAVAKERGFSPNEVRNALIECFGNRVQFKRGRSGGIHLI